MKKVFAILMVIGLLLSAMPAYAGGGIPPITVGFCWDKPMELYGQHIGKHLDLSISGGPLNTSPDGLWTTVREQESGKMAIISYHGPGALFSGHFYHNLLWSIRGSEVITFVPGNTYLIEVWRAPYTTGYPSLTNVVFGTSVTAPTKFAHNWCGK